MRHSVPNLVFLLLLLTPTGAAHAGGPQNVLVVTSEMTTTPTAQPNTQQMLRNHGFSQSYSYADFLQVALSSVKSTECVVMP